MMEKELAEARDKIRYGLSSALRRYKEIEKANRYIDEYRQSEGLRSRVLSHTAPPVGGTRYNSTDIICEMEEKRDLLIERHKKESRKTAIMLDAMELTKEQLEVMRARYVECKIWSDVGAVCFMSRNRAHEIEREAIFVEIQK